MKTSSKLISSYTRAQAISDGALVDASTLASEAGIKFPCALTCAAWERCVALPMGYRGCQDESGRLWDVLWMLRVAMRNVSGDTVRYKLSVRRGRRQCLETLKAVCGPGDHGEPTITIMLPDED